ncbi:hypothetical protein GCK72_010490 [Caenorhabditis remanei]|nr:hypothetical protein GCK72_010490 [Caenorhabditis remanei]KAF1762228.1 hypothetical protein GCK72_010490 [Caenorhabditis remanei]
MTMTRDGRFDSMDKAAPQFSFRRRTMATSEMKEFLSTKGVESTNLNLDDAPDQSPPSTSTRRMSFGETMPERIYDWEDPRLGIQGFVADYFTYRIEQSGLDWYDAPALPDGVQDEFKMMRSLATIFEKKHTEELENCSEQLLAVPKLTFHLYQEVAKFFDRSIGPGHCSMSYGHLIGLISFGGMVAAKMMGTAELQGQVRNLLLYTSLFIKTRIRQCWKEHDRSWAGFMALGKQMKEDFERDQAVQEGRLRNWSLIGAGVIAAIVCGRIVYSFK